MVAAVSSSVVRFKPTKTENSSGQEVDWPITPEIAAVFTRARAMRRELKVQPLHGYVITDRKGKPESAAACRDACRDGLVRAKLGEMDYVVKDIRAKALTDAQKAGYHIDELQVAGAHADRATTEDYIKQRGVPVSVVRLHLPAE